MIDSIVEQYIPNTPYQICFPLLTKPIDFLMAGLPQTSLINLDHSSVCGTFMLIS